MTLEPLGIDGVMLVRFARHQDDRGWFQRTYDREAFLAAGLADCSLECSLSWNPRKGTLRGLHFQRPPHGETKLVRCLTGRIFDVAVDVRSGSASFGRWVSAELSGENGLALYLPRGFAHGFLTLDEGSLVQYQMAEAFVAGSGSGIRWDDPEIGVIWPSVPVWISDRDRSWCGLEAHAIEPRT